MSTAQLTSRTPRRAYIIAPSVKQKWELLKRIDRYCSLYYITMGSVYNIAQTAMVDAYNAIKDDKKLYRQQTKQYINKALAAYDTWDSKMRFVLADRYRALARPVRCVGSGTKAAHHNALLLHRQLLLEE